MREEDLLGPVGEVARSLLGCWVVTDRPSGRVALRLTEAGKQSLSRPPPSDASLEGRIGKLAHSEIRALERGFEILERLPR